MILLSSTNCYTGNKWDTTLCPDDDTCTKNCAVDGADYTATYGATASGSSLKLDFVTNGGSSPNIGSRFYLMSDDSTYEMFNMLNQEFTFDVDVSNLPCGLNGALYMVNMPADGGLSDTNKAGAAYGTGYCDSQCPRDLKFIGGEVSSFYTQKRAHLTNSGTLDQLRRMGFIRHQRKLRRRSSRSMLRRNGHLGGQLHLHRLHASFWTSKP